MKYFTFFPKLNYSFPENGTVSMMNIFIRPNIKLAEIPGINTTGNRYVIEDGESPDNIAGQFYDDPNLFWYVLTTNNIMDIYKEWPISYNLWKKELSAISGNYTFYIPYLMDIKVGDIVAKYSVEDEEFDDSNFGVVIETNSFLRSFDVDFVNGEIKQNENFTIMRKSGRNYTTVTTPSGLGYQNLLKRQNKLDSVVDFMADDLNSKQKSSISPYATYGQNTVISEKIDDITGTNCILDNFLSSSLPSQIAMISFSDDAQKYWIFNKNINIIPKKYTNQISELYLQALSE